MSKRTAKRARKAKVPKPVRAWIPCLRRPREDVMVTVPLIIGTMGSMLYPRKTKCFDARYILKPILIIDPRHYRVLPRTLRKRSHRC